MIIQRNIFIPKRGHQNKVVELIRKGEMYVPFQVPYRILTPNIGYYDTVAFELEFKNLAEQERFWDGWFEKVPESFLNEWREATENGGKNEIWTVAE